MDLFAWLDAQPAAQVFDSGGSFDVVTWCAALIATAFVAVIAFVVWCAFTTPRRPADARLRAAGLAHSPQQDVHTAPIARTTPAESADHAHLAPVGR